MGRSAQNGYEQLRIIFRAAKKKTGMTRAVPWPRHALRKGWQAIWKKKKGA